MVMMMMTIMMTVITMMGMVDTTYHQIDIPHLHNLKLIESKKFSTKLSESEKFFTKFLYSDLKESESD
jgi:hypothetical protein